MSSVSDVTINKPAAEAADQDLDNLIFNDKKDTTTATDAAENTAKVDENGQQPQGDDHDSDGEVREKKATSRASIANVLPVDKLKNGASTATKVLGQGFTMFKEKSSAALEAAKTSNAGTAVAGGLNRAAAAGSEQIGKLKETEAYKKSSSFASTQLERTSVVASGALEKARASASTGLEKAKAGASTGFETLKSKVSSDKKSGGDN
uniref:Uncharacterized protein n=1 Tax=Globisporangium ultimum (strain ATCC 200006 / CBS 805.95 / DAOM BR144) TaxID=431595 RepID=K3WA98_GLOUD